MAAEISKSFNRVLFVAHRREIIEQARLAMPDNVLCMSVQGALIDGPLSVDLLIIDEAHRSAANTYRRLIAKYFTAARLGLTATPLRIDGKGLSDSYSSIIETSNISDLIATGYLVPCVPLEAPDEALKQLAHMRRVSGDYAQRELSALMNTPRLVGDVVREYVKHGQGRKAVAFGVSVEHSQTLAGAFREAGVRAAHLDGRAHEDLRRKSLKAVSDGEIDVLCNVNLFTEGWDCPAVSCVIMARPTASLTLYLQSVGRGMRPYPGKSDLLILDHAGNMERHGYPDAVREWSLEGDKEKAQRKAEVKELERVFALGFDSIEAELEDKRKKRAERCSCEEARTIFGCDKVGDARRLLNKAGVFSRGNTAARYYIREDVNRAAQDRAESAALIEESYYSSAQCMAMIGSTNQGSVALAMRRKGIPAHYPYGEKSAAYFLKSEVDTFCAGRVVVDGYSVADCARTFSIRQKNIPRFLEIRGVLPVPDVRPMKFPKIDIENLAATCRKQARS